jgi:zinc/manganese transport system permease protein
VSAAILVLDRSPHGLEEFKTILNGSIIWVTPHEVFTTFLVYGGVGLLHYILRRQFLALSYEGKGTAFLEFLFFASFAVVLVKSVKLAGILQVFSFLVIPALIGRLYSLRPFVILMIGWIVGVLITIAGIAISYKLDAPTAPVIVAGLALIFFVLLAIKGIGRKETVS